MAGDRRRGVVALLLVVLAACGGGTRPPDFALDGSPRVPDDEGLVTAVDVGSITLDGERSYSIADDLVSFSSIDLSTVPLLFTERQYAQVGLDGDTVQWIGTVARPLATDPPRVVYEGTLKAVDDRQLVFANGTVFVVGGGIDTDGLVGKRVQIGVRPGKGVVTEVEPR